MNGQREIILARVRDAIGDGAAPVASPRSYRRQGTLATQERVELLCARIGDYRAQVRRVRAGALAEAIAETFAAERAARVCVPAAIPPQWLPRAVEFLADTPLSLEELDRVDGVLTGCTLAIAETGTIVLTGAPAEGRRAITLVPDLHVCVVGEEQVVETVPEAMETLAAFIRKRRRPITMISGPSATSDIELSRVEGVHGPRRLIVLVVGDRLGLFPRASDDRTGPAYV
jgi:L-lactate dehydrogenase complex protein LldG